MLDLVRDIRLILCLGIIQKSDDISSVVIDFGGVLPVFLDGI